MATALRYLKVPRVCRLSFITRNSNPFLFHSNSLQRRVYSNRVYYATAAAKPVINDEHLKEIKSGSLRGQSNSNQTIDQMIEKIDISVMRSGRTLSNQISGVLSLLSDSTGTPIHGLYLLRACKYVYDISPKERVQLVNEVWNRFQERGIKFDVSHYNALLKNHIQNGFDFNPAEILASMEELAIEPNNTTYLCFMQKYCKDGNLIGASEILEFIKQKGFSANEDMFNCLIEGHINNGDFPGALDMLEVMRSSKLEPSGNTYTILACYHAANGKTEEMFSCLNHAEKGVTFTFKNYFEVIKALAVSGHTQEIDKVFSMIQDPPLYQQELINASLELIHMDFIDIAYKFALASADSHYNQGAIVFIQQLVKSKKPLSQIKQLCSDIKSRGICDLISHNAAVAAADYGNVEYTLALLEMKLKEGLLVRITHFLPLFFAMKKNKSTEGLWSILKKMSELGVPVDFTAYLDIILPMLGTPVPEEFISNIQETGQSIEFAANALFVHYCHLGEIDYALKLTKNVPIAASHKLDIKKFLNHYNTLKVSPSFSENAYFKVLLYILNNTKFGGDSGMIQGKLLAQAIILRPDIVESLMKHIRNNDDAFDFSEQVLNVCHSELLNKAPDRLVLFSKLRNRRNLVQNNMTFQQEMDELSHLDDQGLPCKLFLLRRISYHATQKDVDRVNKLLSIFDKYGFQRTPLMFSILLNMYCFLEDIPKAEEFASKLKEFPDFKLDVNKTLDFATLYFKYMKYGEATEVLKTYLTKPYVYHSKEIVLLKLRKLLSFIRDVGDVEMLNNIQPYILPLCEELGAKRVWLETSIILQLQRNDLTSACEAYKACLRTHRIPVCLNILLRNCISNGENGLLQNVVDATNDYIGKSYTSVELICAFVELGRFTQAEKVIQNLGDHADSKCVLDVALRLSNQNKVLDLERFIEIIKPFVNVDRERLYQFLLRKLAEANDYRKATEVFEKLKKEDIEPCNETIQILTNILKKNKLPIPPELLSEKDVSDSNVSNAADTSVLHGNYAETFINSLKNGDIESAIDEINNMKKGYIRSLLFCHVIDFVKLCLEHDRLNDLSANPFVMPYIIDNAKEVLEPLLEKFSSLGDVKSLTAITNVMPEYALKDASFNLHYCKAYMTSGRHEDLLDELEKYCEKKKKLFSSGVFWDLLQMPDLENKAFDLAVKYFNDQNFDLPISVACAHVFCKGDYNRAKEMLKVYSLELDKFDLRILRNIRDKKNVDLGKEYVKLVNESGASKRVIERAYGTLLDLLVLKGMYDDAAALVTEAQDSQLELHKYYMSTLITLKNALEKENKQVSFRISTEELASGRESLL